MDTTIVHIEDEKEWRDIFRKEVNKIVDYDLNLISIENIEELKKILDKQHGNIIIVMDLRLGGENNTNYSGFHWLMLELNNYIKENPLTSVYVLSGTLGDNELAEPTMMEKFGLRQDQIISKAYWADKKEEFVKTMIEDIKNLKRNALYRISTGKSGKKTDPYILRQLSEINRTVGEAEEADFSFPKIPMLVMAKDDNWDYRNIPDISVLNQIGSIYFCEGSLNSIIEMEQDNKVVSIEASRGKGISECDRSIPYIKGNVIHSKVGEKGDKALIGIIDSGVDILHDTFKDEETNSTRILAIWDQKDNTGNPPPGFTFGTFHTQEMINGYIEDGKIPDSLRLNYSFPDHGTHVASIAAGKETTDFFGGMAPKAKLIFVIPDDKYRDDRPRSLGYSISHGSGLSFLKKYSEKIGLPIVINVCQGMNAGAHDGTSSLEISFDEISSLGSEPGITVVKSAGNEQDKKGHARFFVREDFLTELVWNSIDYHYHEDTIELWFDAANKNRFRLKGPSGNFSNWVSVNNNFDSGFLGKGNYYEVRYQRYSPENGDSRVQVVVNPGESQPIQPGRWTLEIIGDEIITRGEVHAWIERNSHRTIEFVTHVDTEYTISIPGTANSVITVGSIDLSDRKKLSSSSSLGPTRDGREKPDLCAPGENIKAAKSNSINSVTYMSGTSMAAPHVSGAIALMYSYRQKQIEENENLNQLTAKQIKKALINSLNNKSSHWHNGLGFGVIDAMNFIEQI